MTQESKFLKALKEVFVGATIEGESGYINLMRIKAHYFERGVFPQLMRDIDAAVAPFPGFREELFDKLYDFFHRYFSESGSIYFRYTPLHQRVYEKVYSDERDVALFYKTHMLYYVKTDRLFHSMDVVVDGLPFHFDVTGLEHKRANEKRALVFEFRERRADNVLVIAVGYSENGRKTKTDDIVRAVQRTGVRVDEETLERAFRLFERQSEVDFFINKDARAFLREQFDLWLYQYVFEPEGRSQTLWSERRIRQVQVLKDTAYKIIDFIAQFEDELVRIWNKPKFVRASHYIITLERVAGQGEAGQALLRRFLAHPGMAAQVEEWRELGMLDADQTLRVSETPLDERTQFLPLDTRHFPDLEGELAALFDHLDDALDGWLVRSENYQALITLLPKYGGRVNCISIDPPYNTGTDEFIYRDQYQNSSWLTMMENRLQHARDLLDAEGVIFVNIDDHEVQSLRFLMDRVLGAENRVESFVWKKSYGGGAKEKYAITQHEYVILYGRSVDHLADLWLPPDPEAEDRYYKYRDAKFEQRGPYRIKPLEATKSMDRRENLVFPIPLPDGGEVWPQRQWWWSRERVLNALANDELVFSGKGNETSVSYKQYLRDESGQQRGAKPFSVIDGIYTQHGTGDLMQLFGGRSPVQFPKPVALLMRLVGMVSDRNTSTINLDFFAGSGTTAHAVMNLNRADGGRRKYILVEMGEHFETVILPRIKKIAFSDQWRDGAAQPDGRGISHFVKYFSLEQYEDVLRRAVYADAEPLFVQADPYNQYVFLRDLKLLDNAETGEAVMTLDFEQDAVHVHLERLYPDVDVAETLSCVTGQRIRRLAGDEVEFENGERMRLSDPPWEAVKPLIWW